jgi:DNA-binding CsgD family transcriptional regulator
VRTTTGLPELFSLDPKIFNSSTSLIESLFPGLDALSLGIAIIDRRFRYEALNESLATIHNLSRSAHFNKTLQHVLGPVAEKVGSGIERVFSTGRALPNVQQAGKLPKRPDVGHWLDYYFPLKDSRGRVVRVGAIVMELKLGHVWQAPANFIIKPAMGKGRSVPVDTISSENLPVSDTTKIKQPVSGLSPREHEVLQLLATGKTNSEISSNLGISVKTVESHRSRVMLKTKASSIVELVHYAIRHGIVELQG